MRAGEGQVSGHRRVRPDRAPRTWSGPCWPATTRSCWASAGQGKTRLIRTLSVLLDDWTPAVAGCEINDHPYQPVCARCQRLAAEQGDDLPITWRHRSERYGEKLATPDTSVGDLIGDIDPVKVAEGRTLGRPGDHSLRPGTADQPRHLLP